MSPIKNKKCSIVFGSTVYKYHNYKSRIIISSTFGDASHETSPGSIFLKDNLKNILFLDNVRAGNDLEWRERIKDKYYKLRKNLRDDSGLNSTFANELYDDGGVVRTRAKFSSNNQSLIKRT